MTRMELVEKINAIAKAAGDAIMLVYQRDFEVVDKSDSSPLTEADLAAHKIICAELAALSVDYPILSEESAKIAWDERKKWSTYWLVDPLDGTKEFIKKNGEFTVNIALVENGIPVLGVVYSPALETLYYGVQGEGAFKAVKGQAAEPIQPVTAVDGAWKIVGSRSHGSEQMQSFLAKVGEHEMVPMGSSLKICLVAEGVADLYPRLGPTSEWDTAAAHAVVLAAGGLVTDCEGLALKYNQKESLLNPFFLVAPNQAILDQAKAYL